MRCGVKNKQVAGAQAGYQYALAIRGKLEAVGADDFCIRCGA